MSEKSILPKLGTGAGLWIALVIILLFTHSAVADTSFRCDNKIINTGMTMFDVKQVCGAPTAEQRIGERTIFSGIRDDSRVRDVTYITEWIYQRANSRYILTFEGSRLVRKEYVR